MPTIISTVSIITVISAINQSIKCIRKLSATRKAPEELLALLTEVSHLHEVPLLVAAVSDGQQSLSARRVPVAERREGQVHAALERHWSELH